MIQLVSYHARPLPTVISVKSRWYGEITHSRWHGGHPLHDAHLHFSTQFCFLTEHHFLHAVM